MPETESSGGMRHRLLRHPNVHVARAWWYAQINNRVPQEEEMPATASDIWRGLNLVKIIIRRE